MSSRRIASPMCLRLTQPMFNTTEIAPITILMCVSVISEICYNTELRKCFLDFTRFFER